jgi:TorA maturation chaperone TorD
MELEFLSYLYEQGLDVEIKTFIEDHLDWVPFLIEEFRRFHAHPFYLSGVEVLNFFLNHEREKLEVKADGKKKID